MSGFVKAFVGIMGASLTMLGTIKSIFLLISEGDPVPVILSAIAWTLISILLQLEDE